MNGLVGPIATLRSRLRAEGGFTLVELMFAIGIILVALLALAYTATIGFSDIALARQRQGANGLANQTMEQVRALPFDTLKLGLGNADLGTMSDPNVTRTTCGTQTCYWYGGERIPSGGTTTPVVPLIPHTQTLAVGPTTYTVKAYVTYKDCTQASCPASRLTANTFRVTIEVTWANPARGGVSAKVQTQSIVFSPTGCVSTATHPFAAPCQPFLYATADRDSGHIDVTGAVSGTAFAEGHLDLPSNTSNIQVEQISAVQGVSQTSGIRWVRVDGSGAAANGFKATSFADSDPAQAGLNDYSTASTQAQSSDNHTESGNSNRIRLDSSGGDAGQTTSTVTASVSPAYPCPDRAGVNQTDSQPCGSSNSRQMGTASVTARLDQDGANLGTILLASVIQEPEASVAFTDRTVATGNDGKVHADLNRSLGTVTLADLPAGLAAAAKPIGWSGYLVQVSGFSDTVSVEAGVDTAAPAITAAGTIRFWNGVTYTALPIAAGPSVTIPVVPVSIKDFSTGSEIDIDIVATLATGGTLPASTIQTCSPTPCPNNRTAASATSNSPVKGDITYTVSRGGQTLASLTVHVDLGTLLAKASYQPSPSGA